MPRLSTPAGSEDTLEHGNAEEDEEEEGRLLDGFLLLAAGGSSVPEDVVSVNLSSLQVADVAAQDLSFFVHMDRLDVSDNKLCHESILRQFSCLPRLGTLSLACNSISSLHVTAGTLRHVHTLDLSFNSLHGDVLSQLAHLSSLVTLNLSSNCISLVPPEADICGLQMLEELNMDNNDLVQFVQWRALDALPRLRKLSLASNRIKRLQDDVPDVESAGMFPALEDLDLSSNEIMNVEKLSAVQAFHRLKTLRLSNNPCMRGGKAAALGTQSFASVRIHSQPTKQWYLCGGGCFQVRIPSKEPRLKMNRKKMRKVSSVPVFGDKPRKRSMDQICIYDEEANQLLHALSQDTLRSAPPGAVDRIVPGEVRDRGMDKGDLCEPGLLSDDLSETELDQIFRDRRANIDRLFSSPVEEPSSFMRATPFAESASALANQKLAKIHGGEDETVPAPTAQAPTPTPARSSLFFALTSLDDDAAELIASASQGQSGAANAPALRRSADSPTASAVGGAGGGGGGGGLVLPPIAPNSRGSSAGGSRGDGAGGGRPPRPVPDVGVREAMRALRAAAMSDYAVAA